MAQRTQTILIDDMDGGPADETITFALDGVTYEIDLSSSNAANLRDDLAKWIGHGRRSGGRRAPGTARRGGGSSNREDLQAMRAWGRENGWTVSDRGRVSAELRDAYQKATR